MVKCFVMIGLVGSGKSEQAKKLATEYNAEIFASDDLRTEMFGDVNHQADNDILFKELHKRVRECLASGKNAILDSTNISYKRRMSFLQSLSQIPCEKIAVLMATPYEVCIKRNKLRERKVPEEVIKRMYMNFWVPAWFEGWDSIPIIYSDGAKDSKGYPIHWLETVKDYDQGNSHHSLTLGEHCTKALRFICENSGKTGDDYLSLRVAAILHDEGKPFTRTNINSKGEITEEVHYYNHQFTSSYDSLFFKGIYDNIHVATLIVWHMRPYLAWEQSEKAMKKDRKLLGEKLFHDVLLLHEADKYAH